MSSFEGVEIVQFAEAGAEIALVALKEAVQGLCGDGMVRRLQLAGDVSQQRGTCRTFDERREQAGTVGRDDQAEGGVIV